VTSIDDFRVVLGHSLLGSHNFLVTVTWLVCEVALKDRNLRAAYNISRPFMLGE
jgi:hypothetical protein